MALTPTVQVRSYLAELAIFLMGKAANLANSAMWATRPIVAALPSASRRYYGRWVSREASENPDRHKQTFDVSALPDVSADVSASGVGAPGC